MPDSASRQIAFDDAVHPARQDPDQKRVDAAVFGSEKAPSMAPSGHDINDEEWAANIAQQDMGSNRKQTYSGMTLAWLAFQSTGIIYGDIGTSPLYVFSSTFSEYPSWDDLVGALSIIIWSLTLIVTVKYAFIVLSADDDGQGGTFALYSLLARYTRITSYGPAGSDSVRMERYLTNELPPAGRTIRSVIEKSPAIQSVLKIAGVLGVSMVMADGVLTPAQSVLGAIQGILVVRPDLGTSTIVGVTCAILVILFALQPFGTAKLGTAFAPIVTVWLIFNACAGIYNLARHDHSVLKAFSPYFAFEYLIRNGERGWRSLGGLLLAFTGVEALFADLGAFSKRAIQISWLCLVYPCLLLAYIGQAAYISADTAQVAYKNPFFYTVPPGSLVISILAAIVASQAMITSTFQLLIQVMRLSYFPHIKVVHTSKKFHEQVYVPMANWLMLIGTVIVAAVYNNTTSLGNAYGVCVIGVTFLTTCMVTLVALIVWRLPVYVVVPIFLAFVSLDGAYMSSVLTKVPRGAWFTIVLSAILSSIFILWRFGKEAQWTAEATDRLPPTALLTNTPNSRNPDGTLRLASEFGHTPLATVPGLGIFFDKPGDGASVLPPAFAHFVRKFASRPAVVIFFHMRPLPVASVPLSERYVVMRVGSNAQSRAVLPNCYSVILRHGYTDDVLHPDMAHDLVVQIEKAVSRIIRHNGPSPATVDITMATMSDLDLAASPADDNAVSQELETLHEAALSQVVYIFGKEVLRVRKPVAGKARWGLKRCTRNMLLELYLWIRENSRTKLADLDINVDRLVEVGFVKEI
ncbi:potassium transporter 8 [Grosmannia clavigera kw1407]|uniref:Potassium transporter 8 n=1 Tax=Grosmannia clavigera (strain kw1407 / UAMH 11150) TaxID=655863 RepID=F0XP42_GROCL|nr:potassium transporter 8 [Grosmannia clavigera kw1407]EFX00057.1 potassium transporter 8 [Grosmannia clavigera kw1407]